MLDRRAASLLHVTLIALLTACSDGEPPNSSGPVIESAEVWVETRATIDDDGRAGPPTCFMMARVRYADPDGDEIEAASLFSSDGGPERVMLVSLPLPSSSGPLAKEITVGAIAFEIPPGSPGWEISLKDRRGRSGPRYPVAFRIAEAIDCRLEE